VLIIGNNDELMREKDKRIRQYEQYLSSVPAGILAVDEEFNIKFVNDGMLMTARPDLKPADCIGKKCYEIFQTDACQTDNCATFRCMKTKKLERSVTTIKRADKTVYIDFSTRPLYDEKGNIDGYIEAVLDITGAKTRELELNSAVNIISEVLEKITREGDLTVRVDIDKLGADYKQMGKDLNKAIESMHHNTDQLKHTTDKLQALLKELSTPVIKVWEDVLVMPLIGSMTSDRMRDAQYRLLNELYESNSRVIIIDITGVPVMDTMVANGLLKTIKAVKIIGAETIITGVSPEVASTLVTLDVELDTRTASKLSEGLKYALNFLRYNIKLREE
jgi:rsbT co-antagonist protein RsbR